jgi:translation initiation factor 5A
MSGVKPVDVHSIKEGRYIVMDGVPCVVKKIEKSTPGKHGHAKFRIEGVGVFDGKKRVEVKSTHTRCEVPIIEKRTAQVLSVTQNKAQIMDMESYETLDIDLPSEEDLKDKITPGATVIYWDVMGQKQIKSLK